MAVSIHGGRFYLHVNVDSFVREPEYLRGILLHEVHHVVLGHLSHAKFTQCNFPELMSLAFEMSANENIVEPLPQPIVWKQFEAVGARAGQSTLERYDLLVGAARALTGHGSAGQGAEKLQGDPLDDHAFFSSSASDGSGVDPTRRVLARAIADVARSGADGGSERAPLLAGKEPGRVLEELLGVAAPAEYFIDYKTALRTFVALARAPVHTYTRPNRRFPGRVGEVPGRMYSPRRLARPSVVVAIDTSSSMSAAELSEIARQLAVLGEVARLTVVECDTEITRVFAFDGLLPHVVGRGGTDLRPVFAPELLHALAVDGVIYFTDGDGPFPEQPPNVHVLWVLTKPLDFVCPWGQRALLTTTPLRHAP